MRRAAGSSCRSSPGIAQEIGWRSALDRSRPSSLRGLCPVLTLMRNRPSDLGLAPFGGTAVVFPPAQAMAAHAKLLCSRRSDAARRRADPRSSGCCSSPSSSAALDQRPHPAALDLDLRRLRHRARRGGQAPRGDRDLRFRRHGCCRAGSPTATTTAGSSSGTTGCAGCSLIYLPWSGFLALSAWRPSRCSTGSTGWRRCRRRSS